MNLIKFPDTFDVIVVGGGHAGTEAALASARMGLRCLLLTHDIETLGQMSCNPAIGGIGKGHLVKEIDALGGVMGKAADSAGIQFRVLNASKGKAVRATRAQADRALYKRYIRNALENQANLFIFQQPVEDLLIEDGVVQGVITKMGLSFLGRAVVLTVGTFLGGKIHIGDRHYQGGRAGCPAANALAQRLRAMPFKIGRLKTGTPPRIDGRTIDFSSLHLQPGEHPVPLFSFLGKASVQEQVPCYVTHTSEKTHAIIRSALDRSPLFSGVIEGVGPRYCPSIEDKVVRFHTNDAHQIFLEPEGLNTKEYYPNGISTSLPFDIQLALVRSIKGLENAHITRPGYAIEYDFFDPQELEPSLQTRYVKGLFLAGQINGTTGYEEAAAQGLIAGINAARYAQGASFWTPKREEAYLGVLIDDLITQGTLEPYRMFTSRAEYRLLLREDNADLRLTEIGRGLGLISDERWHFYNQKKQAMEYIRHYFDSVFLFPQEASTQELTRKTGIHFSREQRLSDLITRPEINGYMLMSLSKVKCALQTEKFEELVWKQALEQVEVQAKYAGYIEKQSIEIEKKRKHENLSIPAGFQYKGIPGLSTEITEKLERIRPATLGMASRIAGVTPAAISLLLIYLKRYQSE